MKELLSAPRDERAKLFQEATERSPNIHNPIIIEKDFWVCWTLDQIFSNPILSQYITFKGGTSLSKCYNIIDRFSEDIDLTLAKPYIGIIGDNSPCEQKIISTYAQQLLPALFENPPEIKVTSLTAKRTFWEKVTLLHAEYHRDPLKPLPGRMFRHYYDIVMLDQHGIMHDALQGLALLNDVIRNKITYFPSKWANYETAKIGTLRLYPNEVFVNPLKLDHKNMTTMFFGDAPDFNDTLSEIKRIEAEINKHIV